jgi:hypothetical protein
VLTREKEGEKETEINGFYNYSQWFPFFSVSCFFSFSISFFSRQTREYKKRREISI